MNKEIVILIDYRDQFYFSTKYRGACVDYGRLKDLFQEAGFRVVIKNFSEVNLRNESYKNKWVLYQSSEDPSLYYKDYIEDILLGMKEQGAFLIPEFKFFRAHHNKVFMEVLRDILNINEIKNISSKYFGTYEEYNKGGYIENNNTFVLKPGSGTRSRGVKLLTNKKDKYRYPFKVSKTFTFDNLKLFLSKIRTGKPFTLMSNNRRKFIIQNYVGDLSGDYRILAYKDKMYLVFRANRDGDFRASGSGKLDFDITPPEGLLDFAESIYKKFDTPYMSLDIGYKDGVGYLFEFQCLCLGQYTLEKSKFCYVKKDGAWQRQIEKPDLEREISNSIIGYINNHICVE